MGIGAAVGTVLRLSNGSGAFFMTYQDLITIAVFLAAVLWFSDGGPGTPKRIRIPVLSRNWPT
jgi:hypothetical protein